MSETRPRPLLVYDGDCSFCKRWVGRWKQLTGEKIDYEPYQTAAKHIYDVPEEAFHHSVFLFEPEGYHCSAAHAVFRSMELAGRAPWLMRLYERMPGFARASEDFYRVVARHRDFFDFLDRWLIGKNEPWPSTYNVTRSVFLRLLALIYLFAFVSLFVQIDGLLGSRGITPIASLMEAAKQAVANRIFPHPYWNFPTLTWIWSSDGALHAYCWIGIVTAIVAFSGILPAPTFALMWVMYLTLCGAGQRFLGYQWDILLLEAGFLAVLFAPFFRLPSRRPPSRVVLWLLRWLLFRLMFMSAVVKLASQDPNWWGLTALRLHYETQPLPTWIGYWAHQAPLWFQKFSVILMFLIEGVVPFLYFAPRRPRVWAFWTTVGFQLMIALTGNYGFFNWLAIVLAVTLLPDSFWPRIIVHRRGDKPVPWPWLSWLRYGVLTPIAMVILVVSFTQLLVSALPRVNWSEPVPWIMSCLSPPRIVNPYGLFAIMTTQRHEIVIEGSNDGVTWREYEFKYKPGDVLRRPMFCQPHMPRLDWQMWFAALGDIRENEWLLELQHRLLTNEPAVVKLLANNPFPERPPLYMRAIVYDYHFTTPAEKSKTAAWWTRKPLYLYAPPVWLPGTKPMPVTNPHPAPDFHL